MANIMASTLGTKPVIKKREPNRAMAGISATYQCYLHVVAPCRKARRSLSGSGGGAPLPPSDVQL